MRDGSQRRGEAHPLSLCYKHHHHQQKPIADRLCGIQTPGAMREQASPPPLLARIEEEGEEEDNDED